MAHRPHSLQRGDTLVEVLMAIVILSAIIVGAITMMSRGLRAAQTAVEHSQARLQVTGQSELLRYLRDSYLQSPTTNTTWLTLFNAAPPYADTIVAVNNANCHATPSKQPFYITQSGGSAQIVAYANPQPNPNGVATPGQGMWIEATASQGVTPAFVDFQIKACWTGIGTTTMQQTITTVRFYDPAH